MLWVRHRMPQVVYSWVSLRNGVRPKAFFVNQFQNQPASAPLDIPRSSTWSQGQAWQGAGPEEETGEEEQALSQPSWNLWLDRACRKRLINLPTFLQDLSSRLIKGIKTARQLSGASFPTRSRTSGWMKKRRATGTGLLWMTWSGTWREPGRRGRSSGWL